MKILHLLDSLSQVEEAHPLAAPASRREAFGRIGHIAADLARVAVPFGVAALAPRTSSAQGGGGPSKARLVEVLNFALMLEYLEAEFYAAGLDSNGLLVGDVRTTVEQIRKHEDQHVTFLETTIRSLDGAPVDKPTFDFTAGGTFRTVMVDPMTFLAVAQALEDTGVRAYKGQAANLLLGGDVLQAALQIHSVEARHAAMIRRLRDQRGWVSFSQGIEGVPAADAVYAGEENVTQLGLDATAAAASGGVSAERVTQAYDEPLAGADVAAIAGLFIVG